MNLSRAIAGIISSSSTAAAFRSQNWPSIRDIPSAAVRAAALSTDAAANAAPPKRTYRKVSKPKESEPLESPPTAAGARERELLLSDLPRPSEVPFQPKVANAVHLVGTIGVPLQLQTLSNGTYAAVSVLVHEKTWNFPQFWIPVIFEGDLAQSAACHLKENDVVYITGKLSGGAPSLPFKEAQTNIQVLAHSLSFVQEGYSGKEKSTNNENDEVASEIPEPKGESLLWNDLFANPHRWWDNRSSKRSPKSAAFKHKDTGQLLWVNELTPEWVLSQLEQLSTGEKTQGKGASTDDSKKSEKYTDKSWDDLFVNPHDWWDNRKNKLNRVVNPKSPDFKHKNTNKPLWLDSAPSWVSQKLDGLVFHGKKESKMHEGDHDETQTGQNEFGNSGTNSFNGNQRKYSAIPTKKNDENLWKSLVENPNEWWDNRTNKFNEKSPDFKHKKTGEALWLSSTPQWVMPMLPPLKSENKSEGGKKTTAARTTLLS